MKIKFTSAICHLASTVALSSAALAQTTTLTENNSTGQVNTAPSVTPNFTALAIGGTTIPVPLPANLLSFTQSGAGAVATAMDNRLKQGEVTPQDFGAIADGTSHPVSQWLAGGARDRGYANLAAIQADYPMVSAPTDEIDWAATMAAVATKRNVYAPNGQYKMSAALRFARYGQQISGQNWLFTQFYFTNDTNGVEFRQYGADEGDIVSGSILVGPATGEIGNSLRNLRLLGIGNTTSTKDGVNGDNSGAWDGDMFTVDNVFVQGFNRGVYTGGMANTRWGLIATFFDGDGFVGGLATQNGNIIEHLQSSNNTRHNLWLPTGIGWKIFACDTNTGTNDGTADGVVGIEIGDGSGHAAGAHLFGGNGETQASRGARCLYVHTNSQVIWDKPSFIAGSNSVAISPVFVESNALFQYRLLSASGYNAGVTAIEASLGATVLGDGNDAAQCRYGGTNGTTTGAGAVSATDGEVVTPSWMPQVRDDGVPTAATNLRGQFRYVFGRNGTAADTVYGYKVNASGTAVRFSIEPSSLLSIANLWEADQTFDTSCGILLASGGVGHAGALRFDSVNGWASSRAWWIKSNLEGSGGELSFQQATDATSDPSVTRAYFDQSGFLHFKVGFIFDSGYVSGALPLMPPASGGGLLFKGQAPYYDFSLDWQRYVVGDWSLNIGAGGNGTPTKNLIYVNGAGNKTTIGHNAASQPSGTKTLNVEGTLGTTGDAVIGGNATISGGVLHLPPIARPGNPAEGDIYNDSSDHHTYEWNGTAWKQLDS